MEFINVVFQYSISAVPFIFDRITRHLINLDEENRNHRAGEYR